MSRVWSWRNAILKSKLPATTKHVLMVISCHMNDMGEGCFPSTKRIAEYASLSERSVCTHIEEAGNAGWLQVNVHGYAGQGWKRHEYSPLWPEGAESDDEGTEPRSKGTEPDDKKVLKQVQPILSGEQLNKSLKGVRLDEFYSAYPRKVDPKGCRKVWLRENLDVQADEILSRLKLWKACEQWQNPRFIPHPATFLNQERWKDIPPAAAFKSGDLKFRETTADEKAHNRFNQEIMRLRKLPENLRATDDEITEKARDALRAA